MSKETIHQPRGGWTMAGLAFILLCLTIAVIWLLARSGEREISAAYPVLAGTVHAHPAIMVCLIIGLALSLVFGLCGFVVLQPNEAGVLLLFGRYVGTIKDSGFFWVFPLYTRRKISLRLQNYNGERLKVNDKAGNPVEIAAVLVWKVEDTYAASFEVESYTSYVKIQSESALRHLASAYPYDSWESGESEITLRGHVDEVSKSLEGELKERLHKAGVVIIEARLSHLAYAPEIAEAMLRRQQATAIVAARQKIVEGAVGMVRLALEHLSQEHVVELDEERKAAMVSNLLVVLCGEHSVQPVVNTGTLYQ